MKFLSDPPAWFVFQICWVMLEKDRLLSLWWNSDRSNFSPFFEVCVSRWYLPLIQRGAPDMKQLKGNTHLRKSTLHPNSSFKAGNRSLTSCNQVNLKVSRVLDTLYLCNLIYCDGYGLKTLSVTVDWRKSTISLNTSKIYPITDPWPRWMVDFWW